MMVLVQDIVPAHSSAAAQNLNMARRHALDIIVTAEGNHYTCCYTPFGRVQFGTLALRRIL